ncbi:MAG: integrase family protein [Desulfovermiculus sp.]
MAVKLTKKVVDSLDLPESGQKFVWDTELKGFGLRLTPKGLVYVAQARVNGKTRRVKVGEHGRFTVQEARDDAREKLRDMGRGIDPSVEKVKAKACSVTLRQVTDAYIKDRGLKESTVDSIERHMSGVFNDWTEKPIVNITRQSVLQRFRDRSKESKALANQAFRVLRAILNYARATYRPDDQPVLPENPCSILSDAKMWNNIQPKNRRIPTDKVGNAWNDLQRMMNDPGRTIIGQNTAAAVAFALLTGGRWGEVSTLTWDRVNLKDNSWHIPDPKNKQPVTLPLSKQAKQILEGQDQDTEYVFAGRGESGYVGKPIRVMRTISEAVGETLSAHDLRRTFRAIGGELSIELWKIKLLMNHKLNQDVTINSYTETSDLRYLAEDAQRIGDWIERQGRHAKSKKVVELEAAKQAAV